MPCSLPVSAAAPSHLPCCAGDRRSTADRVSALLLACCCVEPGIMPYQWSIHKTLLHDWQCPEHRPGLDCTIWHKLPAAGAPHGATVWQQCQPRLKSPHFNFLVKQVDRRTLDFEPDAGRTTTAGAGAGTAGRLEPSTALIPRCKFFFCIHITQSHIHAADQACALDPTTRLM